MEEVAAMSQSDDSSEQTEDASVIVRPKGGPRERLNPANIEGIQPPGKRKPALT